MKRKATKFFLTAIALLLWWPVMAQGSGSKNGSQKFGAQIFMEKWESDIDGCYGLSFKSPEDLRETLTGMGFVITDESESKETFVDDYEDEEYEALVRTVKYEKDGKIVESRADDEEGGVYYIRITFPDRNAMDLFISDTAEEYGPPYDQTEDNVYFFPANYNIPYNHSINLDIDQLSLIVGLEGG